MENFSFWPEFRVVPSSACPCIVSCARYQLPRRASFDTCVNATMRLSSNRSCVDTGSTYTYEGLTKVSKDDCLMGTDRHPLATMANYMYLNRQALARGQNWTPKRTGNLAQSARKDQSRSNTSRRSLKGTKGAEVKHDDKDTKDSTRDITVGISGQIFESQKD